MGDFDNVDTAALRKELAEIKEDMVRQELEEIKRERMKKELEEIKRDRAASATYAAPAYREPQLSWINLLLAAVLLLAAGYVAGTLLRVDVAGAIDGLIGGYGLPINGTIIAAALAVIMAAFGVALITIAKK